MIESIITTAIMDAVPNGVPVRSPAILRTVIDRVAHQAYAAGRDAAIGELLTPPQVAAMLGIDRTLVLRIAKARGVGQRPFGRDWVFTPADVEVMRNRRTLKSKQA